jgi:hypothetical protein
MSDPMSGALGARFVVPEGLNESSQVRSAGIGKKYGPVPEGRLKWGCPVNYACRISHLPRIRLPVGTRPFFVCYPGNKLPGYYREVPPGQEAYPASLISAKLALRYCRHPPQASKKASTNFGSWWL